MQYLFVYEPMTNMFIHKSVMKKAEIRISHLYIQILEQKCDIRFLTAIDPLFVGCMKICFVIFHNEIAVSCICS